jgi:hypothetical protein
LNSRRCSASTSRAGGQSRSRERAQTMDPLTLVKWPQLHVRKQLPRDRQDCQVDEPACASARTSRSPLMASPTHWLCPRSTNSFGPSHVPGAKGNARTWPTLAPKMPSGSGRRTYGDVGRGLKVLEQECEQGRLRLGLAQQSLRVLAPAQAHFPAPCASLLNGSRHCAGGEMIFTTNSFSRTRGGHRGLDAHRMSEKPLAREVMRYEESEQVGGHGVEGVWGGRRRGPVVADDERVHGTRKIVCEDIVESEALVNRVADAETLRCGERERGVGGRTHRRYSGGRRARFYSGQGMRRGQARRASRRGK